MKNTLENKAKFLSLYYGQKVFCNQMYSMARVSGRTLDYTRENSIEGYLELRPITLITDNDAIEVANMWNDGSQQKFNKDNAIDLLDYYKTRGYSTMSHDIVDYLRSKGYALPYMGLSVDKLVQYGWIKLKEA